MVIVVDSSLLTTTIRSAWQSTEAAFRAGSVNSERTLQAVLYHHLHGALADCAILCEPIVEIEDHGTAIPDMLIVREEEVVAAIELKFKPHGYPVWEEDIRKLSAFGRATGKYTNDEFRFASNCLLVFGAVGRSDADATNAAFLSTKMALYSTRFVPLSCTVSRGA